MGTIWRTDLGRGEWDTAIADFGGHPLQSRHWGEARQAADRISYQCLAAYQDDKPVWLARIELRRVPMLGRVAWIPKGPVALPVAGPEIETAALQRLKRDGYMLVASNPWNLAQGDQDRLDRHSTKTLWIDLTVDTEELWGNLDKQWRYGVRVAERAGVEIERSRDETDCKVFFDLCQSISQQKGFELPASPALMLNLLRDDPDAPVSSHLFIARYAGRIAAGAFILKCGRSVHYFWGATDRDFSKQRAGEAVQWAVIEWGKEQGCTTYDLEGVDPESNPGVAAFKQKMGGTVRTLSPISLTPFGIRGQVLQAVQFAARSGLFARKGIRIK